MNFDEGFYLTSNDFIEATKIFHKKKLLTSAFVSVANLHSLHVLSYILEKDKPSNLFFFDINSRQIKHLKNAINLIRDSKSRLSFIKDFFCLESLSNDEEIISILDSHPKCKSNYGSTPSDNLDESVLFYEKKAWLLFTFDEKKFRDRYYASGTKTEKGLQILLPTVGDVTSYYSTLFSCSKKDYDTHAFPLGWGSGFLRSEKHFHSLVSYLQTIDIKFEVNSIENSFAIALKQYRYSTIYFWSSNIFSSYFLKKFPALPEFLKRLYSMSVQYEPNYPELDLVHLFDYRDKGEQNKYNRQWHLLKKFSNHTYSFSCVTSKLKGKTLEVVNQPQWIKKDLGISKLPNTDYHLLSPDSDLKSFLDYDTIFLHILVGHGMAPSRLMYILKFLTSHNKRILVLEHNPHSKDFFKNEEIIFDLAKSIDENGLKTFVRENLKIRGNKTSDRNTLIHLESYSK